MWGGHNIYCLNEPQHFSSYRNSDRGDPVSFDLHGLHCDEAVEMLEEILDQALKCKLLTT